MASASALDRSALDWRRVSALGIAIAISGNFAGWNYGLAVGGWRAMVIAALAMALLFFVLAQCLAELAAAFPGGAGFDHYVRKGFGPAAGYVCGLSLGVGLAVGTGLAGSFAYAYFGTLVGVDAWLAKFAMFVIVIGLQLRGAREVAGLTVLTGTVVVTVLGAFYLFTAPHFSYTNLAPHGGTTDQATLASILGCVPYALFLFLGVEQAAQAAAETGDPSRTMPKALGSAVLVVAVIGLATLFFATGSAGVDRLSASDDPLFTAITSNSASSAAHLMTQIVSVGALVALTGTFFSLAYAASRQFFHLARAGDMPKLFATTNKNHAPWGALVVTGLCGLVSTSFQPKAVMVVFIFLVCISYLLVLGSFMRLRYSQPGLSRPYRAPGGSALSVVGICLVIAVAVSCYRTQPAVLNWCLAGLALSLMHHMVRSHRRNSSCSGP